MPGGKLKLGGKHKPGECGSVEKEQTCKQSIWCPKRASP